MHMLVVGFAVQGLSLLALPFLRGSRKVLLVTHGFLLAGLLAGLSASLPALLSSGPVARFDIPGIPDTAFSFDPLGLFFLCMIQFVSIPTTLYSYSYFLQAASEGRPVRSIVLTYGILLISTQFVVLANHAVLFLVFWELMTMAAYFGIVFESEKKAVRLGGMYYFAVSHVIVFLLYAFFFLLHAHTQSWCMSNCHLRADAGEVFYVMYALALLAFGMKAGFMPFHFWLPRAHPIAPTVFSAFLSGVIIKTGIYGMLRTFQMLQPTPEWLGWIVLLAGLMSAIFGVWYALAQHDIKTLLAYHSVENIGIIGIGIGVGFIGSAYHSVALQMLGFGGALMHTLNHSLFKSLLFIGSGVIAHNAGTRIIERMGGLVHRAKGFVALFLIGSVAISGLPPLNGFISEFILYNGFFTAAKELQQYYPLLMLLVAVGLAFVGGLAVVCFTKVNAIMFLGSAREAPRDFPVTPQAYAALGMLAFACIAIGLSPRPFIAVVASVVSGGMLEGATSPALTDISWLFLSQIFGILTLGVLLILAMKTVVQRKYGMRVSETWACGYADVHPGMQYTASSFSDALNTIAKTILRYTKSIPSAQTPSGERDAVETHSSDLVDTLFLRPGYDALHRVVERITVFRYSDVRAYVAAVLVIIIVYSILGFLWK